jgi:Antibiotic biosynthesis monooxygenase
MAALDAEDDCVVLIKTFTVDPSRADELLAEPPEATTTGMAQRPEFISANLQLSDDERRIADSEQWQSQEDIDAIEYDLRESNSA